MARKNDKFGGDFLINNVRELKNQHNNPSGGSVTIAPTFLNNTAGWTLRRRGFPAAAGAGAVSEDDFELVIPPSIPLEELLYWGGSFSGSVDIGGETITSVGNSTNRNGFIAKTHADGSAQWVATIESESEVRCTNRTVDPSTGDVYVAATVVVNTTDSDTITVKNSDGTTGATISTIGNTTAGQYYALVVVKYDTNGDVVYARLAVDMRGVYVGANNSDMIVDGFYLDDGYLHLFAYASTYFANRDIISLDPEGASPINLIQRGFPTADPLLLRERDACFLPFGWKILASDGSLPALSTVGRFFSQGFDPQGRSISYALGYGDADGVGQTTTPLGRHVWPLNFVTFTSVIRTSNEPTFADGEPLIGGASNRQPQRFMVRGGIEQVALSFAVHPVVNPSTAYPAGGHDNNAGSLARSFVGSEDIICAAMLQQNTGYDEVMWHKQSITGPFGDTAFTPDTEDDFGGLTDGTLRSGVALARFNLDTGTKTWSRHISVQDNGWDNGAKDMVFDEDNGYGYLLCGINQQFGPEWDGSSLNNYRNRSSPGYGLIKFDLATGATVWWAAQETDSTDMDGQRFSVALTDDHVVVTTRIDGIVSQTPNGILVRNSNLDGHRAAKFINLDASLSHACHMIRFTKAQGLVVDTNELGTGDADAEILDARSVIPPPASGYAAEPASVAAATLTPSGSIFSAEAAAALGHPGTSNNFFTDGSLPDVFTDLLLDGSQATNAEYSATGGPGGGTDHNVASNLPYFGLTAGTNNHWVRPSTAQTSPGIVLVCARVTTIGSRQVIFCGTTANWEIAVNASGYLEVNAGTLLTATGTAITSGEWFWAAVLVNGASSAIECSVAQSASGDAGSNSLDDVRLFNDPAASAQLIGRMNALKIWSGSGQWADVQAYAAARWDTL
jgi:hypothetical protein